MSPLRRSPALAPAPALALAFAPALALGVLLLGAGCSRDKGAVLVRWRIVDSSTVQGLGQCREPGSATALKRESNACCGSVSSQRMGSVPRDIIIDHIRLRARRIGDVDQPSAMDVACATCCFTCSPFEKTTDFELSAGTYKLWIEALRCGVVVGSAPPAVVREVVGGGIVNLNSIEIRIDPETMPGGCAESGSSACSVTAVGLDAGIDLAVPVDLASGGGG